MPFPGACAASHSTDEARGSVRANAGSAVISRPRGNRTPPTVASPAGGNCPALAAAKITSRVLACSPAGAEAEHRGRRPPSKATRRRRSEEHTSELQSRLHLVCRLLLEKKKNHTHDTRSPAAE